MNDFRFALLDTTNRFDTPADARHARERSIGFTRFKYDGPIIESDSPDQILRQVAATAASHCLVLAYGSFISERWEPGHTDSNCPDQNHDFNRDFLHDMTVWMKHHGVMAAGCSGSGQPDLVFVDLTEYRRLNAPALGSWRESGLVESLPAWALRHVVMTGHGAGNSQPESEMTTLTGNLRKAVFVWNIEPYDDIETPAPTFTGPVTSLYSVAAGLKPNRILETHGFNQDSRLVVFDYSLKGLEYRQAMHEQWDGEDYPGFLRQRFQSAAADDVHYLLWQGATPEKPDWSVVESRWQAELNAWGGADAFRDHWRRFKAMRIEYLHCDLIRTPEILLEHIRDQGGSLIWWSNAFLTLDSIHRYTIDERKRNFRRWIASLARLAPEMHLYGSDCNNLSVNGYRARDYADWLLRPDGDPLDELVPTALNRVTMKY